MELDAGLFREVTSRLVEEFDRPDVALDMANDNVHRLSVIAGIFEASARDTELAKEVRARLVTLLERKCRGANAPAWALAWLARVYSRQDRIPDAIAYYRRALSQDYAQVDWRYHLARLLSETGAVKEAIQEARTCLRIKPADPAVTRLIERLTRDVRLVEQASQTR